MLYTEQLTTVFSLRRADILEDFLHTIKRSAAISSYWVGLIHDAPISDEEEP
jgi:hypothetical protein